MIVPTSFWTTYDWYRPVVPNADHVMLRKTVELHDHNTELFGQAKQRYLLAMHQSSRTERCRLAFLRYDVTETRVLESHAIMFAVCDALAVKPPPTSRRSRRDYT